MSGTVKNPAAAPEKLPPHSDEAEEALLGTILSCADYEETSGKVELEETLSLVKQEDFFNPKTAIVFESIKYLAGKNIPALSVAVAGRLEETDKIMSLGGYAGGRAYLAHLSLAGTQGVHAPYYANIISKCAFQRRLIEAAGKIAGLAYAGKGDTAELQAQAREILDNNNPSEVVEIVNPQAHAELLFSVMSERVDKQGEKIAFGFDGLDFNLGGMYPGEQIIIGARPSTGKTELLLEMALSIAYAGKKTLFCSAEMPVRLLAERELSMHTGLSVKKLRLGEIEDAHWDKANIFFDKASKLPLYFLNSKTRLTSQKIMTVAERLKQSVGLDIVIVDYLQILRDKVVENEHLRVGGISSNLKAMAKELDIISLVASQLSRSGGIEGKPPTLTDLRASGSIEEDADTILLLHRPELSDPKKEPGILKVKIAKSREVGEAQGRVVKLEWDGVNHCYKNGYGNGNGED